MGRLEIIWQASIKFIGVDNSGVGKETINLEIGESRVMNIEIRAVIDRNLT